MNVAVRYRVNNPKVVSETIDGEVVMINLESGSYYSTDRIGAEIWNFIEQCTTPGEILHSMSQRYDGSPKDIEVAVLDFMKQLKEEKLIVADGGGEVASNPIVPAQAAAARNPFVKPSVQKYDDMQELLLADPIHDFDEAGWPNKGADPSSRK
jgi:hypothetical protein